MISITSMIPMSEHVRPYPLNNKTSLTFEHIPCITCPNSWKKVLTCLCVSSAGLSSVGLGKLQTMARTALSLVPSLPKLPWIIMPVTPAVQQPIYQLKTEDCSMCKLSIPRMKIKIKVPECVSAKPIIHLVHGDIIVPNLKMETFKVQVQLSWTTGTSAFSSLVKFKPRRSSYIRIIPSVTVSRGKYSLSFSWSTE